MLVEKVTGRPFAAALRDRIIVPLHLNSTTYEIPKPRPGAASGTSWNAASKESEPQERWSSQMAYSAGALNSNVDDLVLWTQPFLETK